MFPITSLPNAALALAFATGQNRFRARDTARKSRFDEPPARREIAVARWQLSNRVQVFRQHHDCVRLERMIGMRFAKRRAKRINLANQQIASATKRDIHGKEIATTVDAKSFVSAHRG
jgi:hypothetical protein